MVLTAAPPAQCVDAEKTRLCRTLKQNTRRQGRLNGGRFYAGRAAYVGELWIGDLEGLMLLTITTVLREVRGERKRISVRFPLSRENRYCLAGRTPRE